MATASFIPVSEYLRTSYEPNCDYIDGELEERNIDGQSHGALQVIVGAAFRNHRKEWGVRSLGPTPVQISPTRFRVPDLCILKASDPKNGIVRFAPMLIIEILSKEDRLSAAQDRVDDYWSLGVRHIWFIDEAARSAYYATDKGFVRPNDRTLRIEGTPIEISLTEAFAELDEF